MSNNGKILLGRIAFVDKGPYDAATPYEKNHYVVNEDSCFVSLKDGNKGNPLTDTNWWRRIANGEPATKAAASANSAATAAQNAASSANKEAARAKQYADNPPYVGDNGYWWAWSESAQKYQDTGVWAKGGILYPSLYIDPDSMCLYMAYQDELLKEQFEINEEGALIFKMR